MKTRTVCFAIVMMLFEFVEAAAQPAATADVVVDLVAAVQFDHPLFVAAVIAHGGTDLDVDLLVNGVLLGNPDKVARVEYDKLMNLTAWKLVYNRAVVNPGDTLTAVVTDFAADAATRDATCGPGYVRLRQTAICK